MLNGKGAKYWTCAVHDEAIALQKEFVKKCDQAKEEAKTAWDKSYHKKLIKPLEIFVALGK